MLVVVVMVRPVVFAPDVPTSRLAPLAVVVIVPRMILVAVPPLTLPRMLGPPRLVGTLTLPKV